uniref:Uncharacterized protein n=1 Tax=Leptospirillum ferrodiazotrophum TaxID=412449 RepID=C6HWX6_9BACT|nr:MAG: hypothetical protein UBAL3_82700050 [Leptospirillum ferrodiazotrophum]
MEQVYGARDKKMADRIERQGKTTIFCPFAPYRVLLPLFLGRMDIEVPVFTMFYDSGRVEKGGEKTKKNNLKK